MRIKAIELPYKSSYNAQQGNSRHRYSPGPSLRRYLTTLAVPTAHPHSSIAVFSRPSTTKFGQLVHDSLSLFRAALLLHSTLVRDHGAASARLRKRTADIHSNQRRIQMANKRTTSTTVFSSNFPRPGRPLLVKVGLLPGPLSK